MSGSVSLRLPGAAADLREEQVDTERCALVFEVALQLGDLLAKHVWRVSDTTDHAEPACVADGCCELRAGGDVHAGEHDGVVDLEEVGGGGADLL